MTKDMWTIVGVGLVLAGLLLAQSSDISELRAEVGDVRAEVRDVRAEVSALRERMVRVETIVERLQTVVERAHPMAVAAAEVVDVEVSSPESG